MTLFGTNLQVVAREIEVSIERMETYRFNDQFGVTLYDTDFIGVFLNIPDSVYSNYNAWFQLPGEMRWKGQVRKLTFNDREISIPDATVYGKEIKAEWPDFFYFVNKVYCKHIHEAVRMRIFDLVYTTAIMNKLSMKDLLDRTAIKW